MTRVVLAPDKFRGSISAVDAAAALSRGILSVAPDSEVSAFPVADGGEGTVELLLSAGFQMRTAQVSGPLGELVTATYAVREDTAVVEAASACGLSLLPGGIPTRATALAATSFGLGELIAQAMGEGARRIVIGLGGTCCTDGGSGALAALGATFRDDQGNPCGPGGGGVAQVADCDLERLLPGLAHVSLVIACDVDSPLTGPAGAARMFSPQKGADPDDVEVLDHALGRWADVLATATGVDHRDLPGGGAAGGLAFGLHAVFGAPIVSGADLLLELVGFELAVADADLVIVGEGSLDAQSLRGKGPVAVARAAAARGKRVIAVAGRSTLTQSDLASSGIDRLYTLMELQPDPDLCMAQAGELLEHVGAMIGASDFSADGAERQSPHVEGKPL